MQPPPTPSFRSLRSHCRTWKGEPRFPIRLTRANPRNLLRNSVDHPIGGRHNYHWSGLQSLLLCEKEREREIGRKAELTMRERLCAEKDFVCGKILPLWIKFPSQQIPMYSVHNSFWIYLNFIDSCSMLCKTVGFTHGTCIFLRSPVIAEVDKFNRRSNGLADKEPLVRTLAECCLHTYVVRWRRQR